MAKKKSKKSIQQAPQTNDVERKIRTVVKSVRSPGVARKIKAALAISGLSATAAGAYTYSKKNESFDQYRNKLNEVDIIDLDSKRKRLRTAHNTTDAERLILKIKNEIVRAKKSSMKTEAEIRAIQRRLHAAKQQLYRAQSIMDKVPKGMPKKRFPYKTLLGAIIALLYSARVAHHTIKMRKQVAAKKATRNQKPLKENESYVGMLGADTRASAKEWQGPNIPYGDDSNRPNLIRKCTMLESDQMKINCLRKLRDQAAMNPFYQHRIDRYIDEITDTYEPTNKPGTIPGNEFKTSGVGDDTPND